MLCAVFNMHLSQVLGLCICVCFVCPSEKECFFKSIFILPLEFKSRLPTPPLPFAH